MTLQKWLMLSFIFLCVQELHRLQRSLLRLDQREHLLLPQAGDQVWHLSTRADVTMTNTHTHVPVSCLLPSLCLPLTLTVCSVFSVCTFLNSHLRSNVFVLISLHLSHSSQGYISKSTPSAPPVETSHILLMCSGSPCMCLGVLAPLCNICAL